MSDRIFLGLGSSIGNAEETFASAENFLKTHEVTVIQKSKIFKNPPIGGVAQNEFSNAVWEVGFSGTPEELLNILQKCEEKHGRPKEHTHWADRTLDLDILLWGNQIVQTKRLSIPHPEIPNRNFVLIPLSELVDETFEIPTFGALKSLRK